MQIVDCASCDTRVALADDGTCPSCGANPDEQPGDTVASAEGPRKSYFSEMDRDDRERPTFPEAQEDREISSDGEPSGILWILFSFEGRIPRHIFIWSSVGISLLRNLVVFGLPVVLAEDPGAITMIKMVLFLPYAWACFALRAKRWHDLDKSAFWMLINLIPILGTIGEAVVLVFMQGTHGSNKYGHDRT